MIQKLIEILPPAYRKRGIWVAFTLLCRALLNLIGLAVLLPVLALVLDPQWIESPGMMHDIYLYLGISSPEKFALTICAGVVGIILIKSLLIIGLTQVQNRYVYSLYRTLSRRLFSTYQHKGLGFIKKSNSAMLTRNVNVVCLAFVGGILTPIAGILVEALLLLLLFATLVLYSPISALLATIVFLPSVWLYYVLIRNRMEQYGDMENKAQREKFRLVAETFRGFADIEINHAFPKMLHSFDEAMDKIIGIRLKDSKMRLLPQTLTETGLAIGLAVLVAIGTGSNPQEARLLFGVFAVAALRLMPSVKGILSGWTAIKYNLYTIDILQEIASQQEPKEDTEEITTLPFDEKIEVRHLAFQFEDSDTEIFHDLNLTIHKGERLGIRGSSGAGKTTLFNLLLGLYPPKAGEILIDQVALTPQNKRRWQQRIGYVSQHLFLADASFAANVALGIPDEEIDRQRVKEALQAAQLGEFIESLPNGVDTPIGECGCRLSGGQRQRIGIARALYRKADVLFFDEATSALDAHTEEEVNRAIARLATQQKGLTLIVIAHRETTLEYCSRVITLEKDNELTSCSEESRTTTLKNE